MMPIGPLMIEHRLIERMVNQLNAEIAIMQTTQQATPKFIDAATDFFRIYADFCHHGKEEHILFSELESKPLVSEHRAMLELLIQEHAFARRVVKELIAAKELYEQGNEGSVEDIERIMSVLSTFYPAHIEKEDKHFFIPSMEYFSQEERDEMLKAFWEFDRRLIHELYREKVMELEQQNR
ncbi:MAG TPA: hemerythrin domain-containing protein [Candidatus Aquicultor sp.]|jgi:hemerythrin-like domain-containing protein